jgi:thioredoxin-like negative regulator of GroEL
MVPPGRSPSDPRPGAKRAAAPKPPAGRGAAARSGSGARKSARPEPERERALPPKWGKVARSGARVVRPAPGREDKEPERRDRGRPPEWEPERWTSERVDGAARSGASPAAKAAAGGPAPVPAGRGRNRKVPKAISAEVGTRVEPSLAPRVERRLAQAADAFERDHLPDALRILRPLSKEAPAVPAVRELTGLALYGTGQWAAAAKELEAFRELGGSVEQHPVLADCYRALKRYDKVAELWDELREASPGAALVTEGRIVAAGALADQGDVRGAIRLLERGPMRPSRGAAPHHARLWYALADLYERAGDAPKARELFARVVAADPGLADAAERLSALA